MKIMFMNALIGGDFSTMDVSITLLASIINAKSRHRAYIADTTFHKNDWKQYIDRKIRKIKPDIIAFSCNTLYMNYVGTIGRYIKQKFRLPIICGGYHTTVYPLRTIKLPFVDAILLGDGDEKILKILDYYAHHGHFPKTIKGLWIKNDKKIIETGNGDFHKNISNFPHLDWDLWEDLDKYLYYLQMIYFVGSRGCPYACPFCEACEIHNFVDGKYYREVDPVRYAQEIAYQWKKYKSRGMKLAQLFDPVPTLNKDWLKKFCAEYKKLLDPKKHPFSIFSRIDNIDENKLKMLKSAGCKIIRYGVESGDDKIRMKVHKKMISTNDVLRVTSMTKKFGIVMTVYFILGAPTETRKTILRTKKLALKIGASRTAIFIYKPITRLSVELVKASPHDKIDVKKFKSIDNLQYGAVINLSDINCKEIERIQASIYIGYLGKKIFGMIREDGPSYFLNMFTYLRRGFKDRLNIKYLLPYYHIYAYNHITK